MYFIIALEGLGHRHKALNANCRAFSTDTKIVKFSGVLTSLNRSLLVLQMSYCQGLTINKKQDSLSIACLYIVFITTNSQCNQPLQALKSKAVIKKSFEKFSFWKLSSKSSTNSFENVNLKVKLWTRTSKSSANENLNKLFL